MNEPVAYMINYMTGTGQYIFSKWIKRSDNDIETIREAYCYDLQNQNILKVIRCSDWSVWVYDAQKNKQYSLSSFGDEYNVYVHIVDSIQNDIEMKYGKPKFYKYIK